MPSDDLDALLDELSAPVSAKRTPALGSRPLVLVIDDDAQMRRSLEFLLSPRYDLLLHATAVDGVRALTDEVCAVILDVRMSGNDGFWACEQIRITQPDLPVIFYSAYQNVKNPIEIINRYRPFGYITKSGDPTRLLDSLETATRLYQSTLRSRRLLQSLQDKPDRKR